MSELNSDLDFQDYTHSEPGQSHRPDVQISISPSNESQSSARFGNQGVKNIVNIIQNVSNFQANTSPTSQSSEALQQLTWQTDKHRSKHQRDSIAASGGWALGYFAQYFDVTTDDILQRILWSAIPVRKIGLDLDESGVESEMMLPLARNKNSEMVNGGDTMSEVSEGVAMSNQAFNEFGNRTRSFSYMERFIQSRPDFYGPFWVSTTLIFAVAIFSNMVAFMDHRSKAATSVSEQYNITSNAAMRNVILEEIDWHYSLDTLNMTASSVLFHVTLLPTFLWFLFWFRGCTKYYTLIETICAYGYSLSIFVPVTALLLIQATVFRYCLLLAAATLSGLVLILSFLPVARSDPNPAGSHLVLVLMAAGQLFLAYILNGSVTATNK